MTGIIVEPGAIGTLRVSAGGHVAVTNTHGGQVVDAWFFAADPVFGYASMSHSRAWLRTLHPVVGSSFVTAQREPIVTIAADTSPGTHDITMPACDQHRYTQLGAPGHANCADNLRSAMQSSGFAPMDLLPDPLNLFQNSPWSAEGELVFLESPVEPGAEVALRAERDVVVFLSVCPMDIMPINGGSPRPIAAHVTAEADGD